MMIVTTTIIATITPITPPTMAPVLLSPDVGPPAHKRFSYACAMNCTYDKLSRVGQSYVGENLKI